MVLLYLGLLPAPLLVWYALYFLSVALYEQVLTVVSRMDGTKSSISSKPVFRHLTLPAS